MLAALKQWSILNTVSCYFLDGRSSCKLQAWILVCLIIWFTRSYRKNKTHRGRFENNKLLKQPFFFFFCPPPFSLCGVMLVLANLLINCGRSSIKKGMKYRMIWNIYSVFIAFSEKWLHLFPFDDWPFFRLYCTLLLIYLPHSSDSVPLMQLTCLLLVLDGTTTLKEILAFPPLLQVRMRFTCKLPPFSSS